MAAKRSTAGSLFLAVIVVMWMGLSAASIRRLNGDDPAGAESTLEFVRVLAPKSRMNQLASQFPPHYYQPIETERFEARLAAFRQNQLSSQPLEVTAARYEATLQTESMERPLLTGTASWNVRRRRASMQLLPIGETSMSMRDVRWDGDPPVAAELGRTGSGELALLAPASEPLEDDPSEDASSDTPPKEESNEFESQLTFDWSQAGRVAGNAWRFDLTTSDAISKELWLTLPDTYEPQLDQGVVEADDSSESPAGQTRWRLELGAAERHRLLVTAIARGQQRRSRFRQLNTYRVSLGVLQMQSDLRFDGPLPEELVIQSIAGLQLDARIGDQPIPFERAGDQWLLRIPADADGNLIRLTGLADAPLDSLWTLPRIVVENAHWREGESRVSLANTIQLHRILLSDCQQSDRLRQKSDREEIRIRDATPQASIQLKLAERRPDLRSRSAISVNWTGNRLNAESIAEFSASSGDAFTLRFRAPPRWEIDSIETTPADAVDSENLQAFPVDGELIIPLLKPVSSKQTIRVRLTAHREILRGISRALPLQQFLVGRPVTANHQGVLAFNGAISNDVDVRRLDPNDATFADLLPSKNAIVVDDSRIGQALARRPAERTEYRAELDIRAQPSPTQIQETYRLRCIPEAGAITRIRIQVTNLRAMEWTSERGAAIAARPVDGDEDDSRRWDLFLPRPTTEPVVLTAIQKRPFGEQPRTLGSISMPEAVSQSGTVAIDNTLPVTIDADGMERLPSKATSDDMLPDQLAVFRFNPANARPLTIRKASDGAPANANAKADGGARNAYATSPVGMHAWSHHLYSRFESSGRALHVATFQVRTLGESSLFVRAPPEASILRVSVNRLDVPVNRQGGQLRVRLSSRSRSHTVQVTYSSLDLPASGWAWRHKRRVPLLGLSIPVMESTWTLDVPAGSGLADSKAATTFLGKLRFPFAIDGPPAIERRRADARGVVRQLAASPDVRTWGDLAAALQRRHDGGRCDFISVDLASMKELGVTPQSDIGWQDADAGDERHVWLARQGLDVQVWNHTLVLAHVSRQQGPTESLQAPGAWAETEANGLLEVSARPSIDVLRVRADRVLNEEQLQSGVAEIQIADYVRQRLLALACLMVAAGGVWRFPRFVIPCWIGGWMVCWLLPSWFWLGAAFGWGAMLGALLGVQWLPHAARSSRTLRSGRTLATRPSLATTLSLLFVACQLAPLFAQEPPTGFPTRTRARSSKSLPRLHRVLIPIDSKGEPSSKFVYVPAPLWSVLSKSRSEALPEGWLLSEAKHEVRPARNDSEEDLSVSSTYQLRVFRQDERVGLPCKREEGAGLALTVNGDSTSSSWSRDGETLEFQTGMPGLYDIVVTRRVPLRSDGKLRLTVPALPTATLEVETPPSRSAKTPPQAKGKVVSRGNAWSAQLGAQAEIELDLPRPLPAAATQLLVEEHVWLQIKRVDSVVVRTMFRFQAETPLTEIPLVVGKNLRLLKLRVNADVIEPEETSMDDGKLLVIPVDEPARYLEVQADFHFQGVAGVGRIPAPQIETLTRANDLRRWFAYSVYPKNLQGTLEGDCEPIDAEQFTVSWPEAQPPLAAFRLQRAGAQSTSLAGNTNAAAASAAARDARGFIAPAPLTGQAAKDGDQEAAPLELVVRYVEQDSQADQSARLTLSRSGMEIEFNAETTSLPPNTFQHELKMPRRVAIHSLRVLENGEHVPHRFVHRGEDLIVFLDGPAGDAQRIEVRGFIPSIAKAPSIPRMEITSSQVASRKIELLRRHGSGQIAVVDPMNMDVDAIREGRIQGGRRVVADLHPANGQYGAELSIRPIRRRSSANLITVVSHEGARWVARVHGQVDIAVGHHDWLRFSAPAGLSPTVISPDTWRVETREFDEGSEWRLVPSRPLTGKVPFLLETEIELDSDGVLRVPDISLLGIVTGRYLALPRKAEGRELNWITPRGLIVGTDSELPWLDESYRAKILEDSQLFDVVNARFDASLVRSERVSESPAVLLADIHCHVGESQCFGMAVLDVQPGGRESCRIAIDGQLLHAELEGGGVAAKKLSEGRWSAPLGPREMPQRLTLYFMTDRSNGRLAAPRLEEFAPAEQTIWTVTGDALASQVVRHKDVQEATALDIERARSKALRSVLAAAPKWTSSRPPEDVAEWFNTWSRRLERSLRLRGVEGDVTCEKDVQFQDATAQQLRMTSVLSSLRSEPNLRMEPYDIWQREQRPAPSFHFVSASAGGLELGPATHRGVPFAVRLLIVIGSVLCGAIAVRRLPVLEHPTIIVVAVGVACAAFLPVSWLGHIIVLAGLLSNQRRRSGRLAEPASDSAAS